MLTSPPNPGFQASLLLTARSRSWIPVSGEVGHIDGAVLTVETAGEDRVRWIAELDAKLPHDFAPRLLTKQAYAALCEGELGQDRVLV